MKKDKVQAIILLADIILLAVAFNGLVRHDLGLTIGPLVFLAIITITKKEIARFLK